ncbi:hypothetical protein MUK42_33078 [Musa troglodytarum]|uniref:Uncharacterized protein n=1 Tax=Musa troglodytarum TaxID=320322 RepID=A0A9E7FXM8_9LILI|nr:hypothetical protein MUK42_33078 [Musa troglodytarum]
MWEEVTGVNKLFEARDCRRCLVAAESCWGTARNWSCLKNFYRRTGRMVLKAFYNPSADMKTMSAVLALLFLAILLPLHHCRDINTPDEKVTKTSPESTEGGIKVAPPCYTNSCSYGTCTCCSSSEECYPTRSECLQHCPIGK